jgi:hypothetical protein
LAGFVGFFGASVKQFSSGIPHSREFWAMAAANKRGSRLPQ